jgi:hypothetical protein
VATRSTFSWSARGLAPALSELSLSSHISFLLLVLSPLLPGADFSGDVFGDEDKSEGSPEGGEDAEGNQGDDASAGGRGSSRGKRPPPGAANAGSRKTKAGREKAAAGKST